MGVVELLEGVFHGASSFLLPRQQQQLPLCDVSFDGLMGRLNVAALESYGPPGLRDFLDGALRRQKGGQLRGKEETRGL